MGYDFKIKDYYKIKAEKKDFPWPCKSEPERMITLYDDDILTKSADGTYMKQTGIGCFGIMIPDEDVSHFDDEISLQLI